MIASAGTRVASIALSLIRRVDDASFLWLVDFNLMADVGHGCDVQSKRSSFHLNYVFDQLSHSLFS
jgi:hypothetical protein